MESRGHVEPQFAAVAHAFARVLELPGEAGGAVCVYHRGRPVVDLAGGFADASRTRPYTHETIQVLASTTKAVAAICALRLVERGELALDAPVTDLWPAFAAHGKDGTTVSDVLAHRAGVPAIDRRLTVDEALQWEPMIRALEDTRPLWPPGTGHGYHAYTFGYLVGELVRRAAGSSIGAFTARELAAPLELDLWIGLPAEQEPRLAPLLLARDALPVDPARAWLWDALLGRGETADGVDVDAPGYRAYANPTGFLDAFLDSRAFRAGEVPASNGVGSAHALARLLAACVSDVDGRRLLAPTTVDTARRAWSSGPDPVLGVSSTFGLGFQLASETTPLGGPGSFGHHGIGGSVAWASPERELAFAYTPNRMRMDGGIDVRWDTLATAAVASVA